MIVPRTQDDTQFINDGDSSLIETQLGNKIVIKLEEWREYTKTVNHLLSLSLVLHYWAPDRSAKQHY